MYHYFQTINNLIGTNLKIKKKKKKKITNDYLKKKKKKNHLPNDYLKKKINNRASTSYYYS